MRGTYKFAFIVANLVGQLAALCSPFAMGAFFVLGGAEIWAALTGYFADHDAAKALKHGINALEYIFIAPLPVLLTMAFVRYVYRFLEGKPTREQKVGIMEVKALEMGLFTAAAAAALIGRMTNIGGTDWRFLLVATVAVVALAAIFLAIDMFVSKMEEEPRHDEPERTSE